ncbi:proline-rich receptor-like protein kinase PERK2 isoform X2 [Spinacia oleracea]|uniref:Proline-rich receptor-like protein kinase PERK2 isoform X2 n=1 Tax=Spinacia oleracea TaxID=3562 RepID=A0A9R0K396_SPIOL|nr:proline-rich receptor-like protein kinase PERK2 isoform X2 [Spinacia oleracea]
MKTYVTVAGIVLLMSMTFMPSSAQQNSPFCWNRIETCHRGAETPAEFQQVCCPVVAQIVTNEMPCFCSIKSNVNATEVNGISVLLTMCNINASFDTICPGGNSGTPGSPSIPPPGTPSIPPLSPTPTLSAPPPGPNSTPSLTPSAQTPGPNSNPSVTPSAPTPGTLAPTPMMPPQGEGPSIAPSTPTLINPPLGSAESPTALSPTTDGNTTETPTSAANKIAMAGSLSGLLVLMTYVLF